MTRYALHLDLPADERAPATARRTLAAVLPLWGVADDVDTTSCTLVATELLTNAVRYAGRAPVGLDVLLGDGALTVAVTDTSPEPPRRRTATPGDESGRGVQLVEWLSEHWQVEQLPQGKRVSARMRVTAGPAALPPCAEQPGRAQACA